MTGFVYSPVQCGSVAVGARNTSKRRLTAPVISGFVIFTALCREWTGIQNPLCGEYRPAVLLQFSSYPTFIIFTVTPMVGDYYGHDMRALEKRQEEGLMPMLLAPFFPVFSYSCCVHLWRVGMLWLGAENTNKRRLTAPDISGFSLSTACAGGSREYKTHCVGNTCWPTFCGFFSHPVFSILKVRGKSTPSSYTPSLKRRSKRKGNTAMFSAPFFPVFSYSCCVHLWRVGMLWSGAENTITRRLTAPDISGFSLSTAFAGGSREYKTHCVGNTCWPTLYGFFSHPALSRTWSCPAASPQFNTGLKSRSTRKGSIAMFSAPFFPATRNEVAA
ncbi:MAG: hypothetical protein MSS97_04080 [Arcanobacterium sp.]|nr:hypothetical protein [Arcanobacterium sp.]